MNQTTTVIVALIAAACLSGMVYAISEQRALAWGGFGGCGFGFGCGGPFIGDGCGFGCGGFFGPSVFHKTIQTINQVNTCNDDSTGTYQQPYNTGSQPHKETACQNTCNGNSTGTYQPLDNRESQPHKQIVCQNTAVNIARHGFSGFDFDGFDR